MPSGALPRGRRIRCRLILDAVRAYATLGEICDALRGVFGSYQETSARLIHVRAHSSAGGQAGSGRPRPRRQGDRPRSARRRHGSHLYRFATDAGDDRERGSAGRCAGDRSFDSFRRAQCHRAARDGVAARKGHDRREGHRRRHYSGRRRRGAEAPGRRGRIPAGSFARGNRGLHPLERAALERGGQHGHYFQG